MSHSDISFTSKQKCDQFGLDAKAYLASLKEAVDYVKYNNFIKKLKRSFLSRSF